MLYELPFKTEKALKRVLFLMGLRKRPAGSAAASVVYKWRVHKRAPTQS